MPEAEVNDVPVWGMDWGGGVPDSEREAREDKVADADCSMAGLNREYIDSGRHGWNGKNARRSARRLPCITHSPPRLARRREAAVLHRSVDLRAVSDVVCSRAEAAGTFVAAGGQCAFDRRLARSRNGSSNGRRFNEGEQALPPVAHLVQCIRDRCVVLQTNCGTYESCAFGAVSHSRGVGGRR